jgi:transcriptional regulator with XRE-family HTH domain
MEKLCKRIARQREAIGLTQSQLAEMVGVQPETVCRIECGRRSLSIGLLERVARALEVELHELFQFGGVEARDDARERLIRFISRLSATEIDLVLEVAAPVLKIARAARDKSR